MKKYISSLLLFNLLLAGCFAPENVMSDEAIQSSWEKNKSEYIEIVNLLTAENLEINRVGLSNGELRFLGGDREYSSEKKERLKQLMTELDLKTVDIILSGGVSGEIQAVDFHKYSYGMANTSGISKSVLYKINESSDMRFTDAPESYTLSEFKKAKPGPNVIYKKLSENWFIELEIYIIS